MTVASIDAILILIAPEFAATLQATREVFINLAIAQVGTFSCNASVYDLAVANLAAHMLSISTRRGGSGQITSETEGSLSRSFGAVANASGFGATSYGAEYLRLVSAFILTPMTRQRVIDGSCES